MTPNYYELLLEAVKNSFSKLFSDNKEHFYYCTLVMAECGCPYISAWSEEAFERKVQNIPADEAEYYRWSYADSPYCAYGYDEYFGEVSREYWKSLDGLDDEEYCLKIDEWMNIMERVMSVLDSQGLFALNQKREDVFINAEYMPPEESDIERGRRLNPRNIFEKWYSEQCADDAERVDYHQLYHPPLCDIYLIKNITDKKMLIKLKSLFYCDCTVTELAEMAKTVPVIIKHDMTFSEAEGIIKAAPYLNEYIKLKK